MIVLEASNAHHGALLSANMLLTRGIEREQKGNLYSPDMVTVCQYEPWERLILRPELQLNPFAEMMKAIWTLCGRVEHKPLADYYHPDVYLSEDGKTLRGACGYRARDHFVLYPLEGVEGPVPVGQIDQMLTAVSLLKEVPHRKDCVIQLWDAGYDLGLASGDRPNATQIYVSVNDINGGLDMTVFYRTCTIQQAASDSVALTMMQSFIAQSLDRTPGKYCQVFQTLSAPNTMLNALREFVDQHDPYENFSLQKTTIGTIEPNAFLAECQTFLDEGVVLGMRDGFIRKTVEPMVRAWKMYLNPNHPWTQTYPSALLIAEEIVLEDWRCACIDWLGIKENEANERAYKNRKGK